MSPAKERHPLLFWGLFFLLGCSVILFPHIALIIPIVSLLFLSKRKVQCLCLFALGLGYTVARYPPQDFDTIKGHGVFHLKTIEPSTSPFGKSLLLKGVMTRFEGEGKSVKNVPCVMFQKKVPEQTSPFLIEGTLHKKGIFKPHPNLPWQEVGNSPSLAKWRYRNKTGIQKLFPNTKEGRFFSSMATGLVEDRLLAMEFRKVGLGHILAISGFHFALVAALIGFFCRLFLPDKMALLILLTILTLYFIFLGISPSIFRAYLMISLFVVGRLLEKPVDSLNLLGAALLLELIYDPNNLTHIGFQLSFLATLGIFLFYRPFYALFEKLFPKRSYQELKTFTKLDQHGYLVGSALKTALALNAAVHLVTLPATLAIFGFFPLLSLPYNLILPPFLSLSLLLIPFSLLFPPIAFLNEKYTHFLLSLIANPPEILNFKIFLPYFPIWLAIALVTLLGVWGLTKSLSYHYNETLFSWRS